MLKYLLLVAFFLSAITGFPQQSAQMNASDEVQAGDVATLDVVLDKAPDFADPAILVIAGPADTKLPGVQNTAGASGSKTEYRVSLRIPATAAEGRWVVRQVRLLVPAAPSIALKTRPAEFQVRRAKTLDLPTQASVSLAR